METTVVVAKNITWPKTDKADRTHDTDFMKKLALSIRTEGLLQPPGVRPDLAKGVGHFIGVFGRHRTEAFIKELKEEGIPVIIFADMDDEEAAIAADAENLWRNPLTKAQQARAIARWHENYDKKRKEYEAAVKAEKDASKKPVGRPKKAKSEVQSGPDAGDKPAPEPAPEPARTALPPKPPENFAEHVAVVTGQSPATVKRQLKIGKAFTPAQLEVIEQQGVNQTWQDTIAGLEQSVRDGVINLIATGLSEEEAIARVKGAPEVTRADGKTYEVAPTAPGEKAESDMTDEEWVNFHCKEVVGLLEDPTAFVAHAVLYRHIRDARQAFKAKAKGIMAETKKAAGDIYGGLYGVVNRVLTVAHPSKWLRCGSCNGTGIVTQGNKQSRCKECAGNAFVVKFEAK
jgi:ParB/RepB/Spo0J family partition protein